MHDHPGAPRRTAASVLLALAIVAAGALGGAPPAAADDAGTDGPAVTWGVRTAPGPHGEDRENYAYEAAPGETIEDAIVIANHDDAPLTLDVYAADGFTASSGQLDVATRDETPREIGAWLVPAAERVTIAPGEAVEVPFALTVPADATPGDHAGGLLTTLPVPEAADGVVVDRRLGIRIHLRVSGALAPALAVEDLRVEHTGTIVPFGTGDAVVTGTVRNAGNVRLSAEQTVAVAGPFGLFAADAGAPVAVPELLPGESWPIEVRLDGVVPAFFLEGTVGLVPQLPDGSAAPSVTTTASTSAVPWSTLVLIALVGAAVALWIVSARRRRAERQAREDARVAKAVEQALRERVPTP